LSQARVKFIEQTVRDLDRLVARAAPTVANTDAGLPEPVAAPEAAAA